MSEKRQEVQSLLETLSMYKVLEGLIHNVNTPLNVIIGYSQQLKKQYPNIPNLESITEAGLQIDDLVQSCSRQLVYRLTNDRQSYDLRQWLGDEIKLLRNILEIKHTLQFDVKLPTRRIPVQGNPHLSGLLLESLILQVKKAPDLPKNGNRIGFGLEYADEQINLLINLPDLASLSKGLPDYLTRVRAELEESARANNAEGLICGWHYDGSREVRLSFTAEMAN